MMRTQWWWLARTAPQAWRGPVAAFAVGAILSGPAVASAPSLGAPPFVRPAPDMHPAQLPALAGDRPAPAVPEGGAGPATPATQVRSPSAIGLLSPRVAAASPHGGQAGRTTAARDPAPRRQADTAFDGMLVAAIGTGVAGAGWLLMLAASRRLRRRSR